MDCDENEIADIHGVATLLGHKDLRMTARYSHLSPVFLGKAVGRIDGVFGISVTTSLPLGKSLPSNSSATIEE
jgi:hypothetical protein